MVIVFPKSAISGRYLRISSFAESFLLEHGDRHGRELLGDRGHVEYR